MNNTQRTACAAALLLCLAACGPGTGGTGTGSEVLSTFGATSASVCSADFAKDLACSAASLPTAGTQPVHYSNLASGATLAMTIEGNHVQLWSRCTALSFSGDWGLKVPAEARFFGLLSDTAGAAPRLATLDALPAPDATANLVLTMREADGKLVLGAVTLERLLAPVTVAAKCP